MIDWSNYLSFREENIEKMVLSNILLTKFVSPDLSPEYFDGPEKMLFDAISKQVLTNKAIDLSLLRIEYSNLISEIIKYDPTGSNEATEALKHACMKRKLAKLIVSTTENMQVNETVTMLQEHLSKISLDRLARYNHTTEIKNLLEVMEKNQTQARELAGYSFRIDKIDKITNGIEHGKVYAIGALKKTGKSRFGVYLSCVLKSQGAGIFWNSLEMSAGQLNILATAYFSDLNSNVFMKWMKPADYDRFKIGINSLKFLDWSIYKCHYVNDLRSRILSERQHKKIDIVFVDFIQRMRSLKYPKDRVREVEDLSQELADLSRDLNVAVIEFSQLTGTAEKLEEGVIPDMSHFKESQGTTENADTIMVLHNLDRNKITDKVNGYQPQNFKIRIDQRYDLSGEIIDVKADLRTCKYFE